MDKPIKIPLPSLKRYSIYLSILNRLEKTIWISTTILSRETGFKSITIRKDIAYLNIKGLPQKGYFKDELHSKLKESLGGESYRDLVLVGRWGLGESYSKYPELIPKEYKLRACFDFVDKEDKSGPIPIFPMNKAEELLKRLGVSIVLFSIDPKRIDSFTDISKWGIKGILNLTNYNLNIDNKKISVTSFNPLVNISDLVGKIRF